MDDAPTEEKLSLLFAYDVDRSGTLSLGEMTQIFVKGEPSSAQQRIIERTRMWAEIRMRRGDAAATGSDVEGVHPDQRVAAFDETPTEECREQRTKRSRLGLPSESIGASSHMASLGRRFVAALARNGLSMSSRARAASASALPRGCR